MFIKEKPIRGGAGFFITRVRYAPVKNYCQRPNSLSLCYRSLFLSTREPKTEGEKNGQERVLGCKVGETEGCDIDNALKTDSSIPYRLRA